MARRKLTSDEAARVLGISIDAVRKRAERGQLPHEREGGRLYILLDTDATESRPDVEGEPAALRSELLAELRAHNESLREQLEAEREANRENRRIIAALTSRIPELPAASSERTPEAPSEATEQPGRGECQTGAERLRTA